MTKIGVGIVGCGNISSIYFENLTKLFGDVIHLKAFSDLDHSKAEEKRAQYPRADLVTTDEMLARPDIDLVINLTAPHAHAALDMAAIAAGKHVYAEKPLAASLADGRAIVACAKKRGVLLGSAPDTFLGPGFQTCRRLIDEGTIGDILSVDAFMVSHGHESWHPNPEFYYRAGGGPMLDMGPYYLTALVSLLGPIQSIRGVVSKGFATRTMTSPERMGDSVRVDVPTHYSSSLTFRGGAVGTMIMSFDIWKSDLPRMEIHGTKGSLSAPNPNTFGGPVKVFRENSDTWEELSVEAMPYSGNARGIGVADMAHAIRNKREHRANGDLAYHVLEAMTAAEESARRGKELFLKSDCSRPEPLPNGLLLGEGW